MSMNSNSDSSTSNAERLIDELDKGVGYGSVPAAIFGNDDLYKEELNKVFGRCWVFLAHDSEIPAPGDYVVRKIGEDDFIVVRDEDGKINVMLDACRHRGVQVCRSTSGNTSHFRCPYHGWTYNTKGALVGAPLWKNALEGTAKEDNGLAHAPRVELLHGLIYASLDASAPPLREYLGGMAWYLDLLFGLNEHGVEVLGPPQRFVFDADWKSGSENFAGDDYHLGTLHRSVFEIGSFPVSFAENMKGYHIQASPGHSLSFSMANSVDEPGPKFLGFPEALAASFNTARISAEQLEVARRARVFVGNVFPNCAILALPVTEDGSKHAPTAALTVRLFQPKGPGKVEFWNWFFGYKNMTPEQKERAYTAGLGTFSLSGVFEMDDTEPWTTISRSGNSMAIDKLGFKLNYKMGTPGIGIAEPVRENWPGPGEVYRTRYEEGVQRNMYRFYADMMKAAPGEWPSFEMDAERSTALRKDAGAKTPSAAEALEK